MGTTFEEIYGWMLSTINDYKLDKLYISDKQVVYNFLKIFLKTGLSDFDCLKPLTYHTENINDEDIIVFDYELDDDEKKIIAKIAVANYWKRKIMDIKARLPYMNQREFKKDPLASLMKENDEWYNQLVSEYMADIENYNMKHIEELPFWEEFR